MPTVEGRFPLCVLACLLRFCSCAFFFFFVFKFAIGRTLAAGLYSNTKKNEKTGRGIKEKNLAAEKK
jgi:hypothetical protein